MMRCLLPALILAVASLPVLAGEPAGVDTQALDQCLTDATTNGARLDCAGTQQEPCLDYAVTHHPEVHAVDRQLHCLNAEWQFWENRLNDAYSALKDIETGRSAERADALIAMERQWIAFRDARCSYDRMTNGGGTGGAVAEPQCKLNETARQVVLLRSYIDDRGD